MPLDRQSRSKLADAFQGRGMHQHVGLLLGGGWSQDFEVEWARRLQVPPHEHDYPLLPRAAPCPTCGSRSANRTATRTVVVGSWPRGWAEQCLECRATWTHAERF